MSSSPELDERFADWVDGRLSVTECEQLEGELQADPELRIAAEGYRSTVDLIRESLLGDEEAPAGLADTIVAAAGGAGGLRGAWPVWLGFAAAAGFALYFALPWAGSETGSRETHRDEYAAKPSESEPELSRKAKGGLGRFDDGMKRSEAEEGAAAAPQSATEEQRGYARRLRAGEAGRPAQQASAAEPLDALRLELLNQARTQSVPLGAFERKVAKVEEAREAAEPETDPKPQVPVRLVMVLPVETDARGRGAATPPADVPTRGRAKIEDKIVQNPAVALAELLTSPQVMGEARLGNLLQLSVRQLPVIGIMPNDKSAFQGTSAMPSYWPESGDLGFAIEGTEQELPVYFTRLQEQLASQGNDLEALWAQPGTWPIPQLYRSDPKLAQVDESGEVAGTKLHKKAAPPETANLEFQAALHSIYLVLRRQQSPETPASKKRR